MLAASLATTLPATLPALEIAECARVLCELGQVEQLADLGGAGPLLASAGSDSLFHCLFGRDAIRMAFDLLEDFPAVGRSTLIELARLQGVAENPRAEEESGRILHEHRKSGDPHAERLRERWDLPYFGAVDTTPQWINLLVAYCEQEGAGLLEERLTDRLGRRVSVRDCLEAALGWIVRRLDDPRGGGLLWVCRATPQGLPNQVWEDSGDSYFHEDGTLFDPAWPYAPIAVQGYVYDALVGAADLLDRSPGPLPILTAALRGRAAELRSRVLRDFWQADLGTFAAAVDFRGGLPGRPARTVSSAAGHLLASQLLDGTECASERESLIRRLLQPDLLAAAGIRTKSSSSSRFRAGAYHNGSSWPVDTGVIADGLRRHACDGLADELELRILRACAAVGGFPEFFRGDLDGSIRVNTVAIDIVVDGELHRLEQPPQPNQGWTATRVWRILRRQGQARVA